MRGDDPQLDRSLDEIAGDVERLVVAAEAQR